MDSQSREGVSSIPIRFLDASAEPFSADPTLYPPDHSFLGCAAHSMTSKPSDNSMYQSAISVQQQDGLMQYGRNRYRSQYPSTASQNHVEYILVAAFDIDRGSVMEHQYPSPVSGDETMLAELMLPDQTHERAQDWTIFFLHKESNNESESGSPAKAPKRKETNGETDADGNETADESDTDSEDDDVYGPPLIYVLNHVNTKHDETVTRGAIVKSMAICTRHSFLDIFKPVLVLAIEEYMRSPTIETLAVLYDSLNGMDLSLLPKFSLLERTILQASTAKDLFIEKFERMIEQGKEDESMKAQDEPSHPASTSRHTLPRDTHEYESKILFKTHQVPVKVPTARHSEIVGNFSTIKLIDTFSKPHVTSPQPFTLHGHLTTSGAFTHPIIVLINALLTQKKVIFLGYGRPSEEVVEAVLAACSLASGGVLKGFTRHAFPYTDLSKVDDLQGIPGFIAGVTNPIFAESQGWWDLLCDLSSGRMRISNKLEPAAKTDGYMSFSQQNGSIVNASAAAQAVQTPDYTGDNAFMENVMRSISNRLGEGAVRSMFREWILKMTRMAAAFEEITYGTSALYIGAIQADQGDFGLSGHGYVWPDNASRDRELAANVSRIEGWRSTRSYFAFKQDLARMYNAQPIKTVDLHHHHDRLRTQKLSAAESAAIYLGLTDAIHDHDEICQLLMVTTESHGGLFYMGLGLFHPWRDVRYRTMELLERIARHEAGKHFWEGLGKFAKLAFFRLKRAEECGEVDMWEAENEGAESPTAIAA